jgi:hypothetical protein
MKDVKKSKILVFFGISVILNALFIGFFLGENLAKHPHNRLRMHPERLISYDILKPGEWVKHMETVKKKKENIAQALKQEPYNKQEVLDAFDEFSEEILRMRTVMHKRIAENAGKYSPDERKIFMPILKFDKQRRKHIP